MENSKRKDFDFDHCKGLRRMRQRMPVPRNQQYIRSERRKKHEHQERLSGNEAAAYAIRQIDPDVIAAFPLRRLRRFRSISPVTRRMGKLLPSLLR